MSTVRFRVALLAAALYLIPAAAAQQADFAASYSLSDVNDADARVSALLNIQLINRSGAEVHYGVATVPREARSVDPAQSYAKFGRISMSLGGSVRLRHRIVLNAEEYQRWATDRSPYAEMEWFDDNGVRHDALIRMQLIPAIPSP